jgi:hypothetical protein
LIIYEQRDEFVLLLDQKRAILIAVLARAIQRLLEQRDLLFEGHVLLVGSAQHVAQCF